MHGFATTSAYFWMTNCPLSGHAQGRVTSSRISHSLKYLRKCCQILCACRLYKRPTIPENGVARVTWSI